MSWGVYDYPEPPTEKVAFCPVCRRECYKIYRTKWGEIVGCDDCITEEDATDVPECYEEEY